TFAAILQDNPEPVRHLNPQLPAELERILVKALDKDPLRRYQHASEIREELKTIRAGIRPVPTLAGRAHGLDRNLSGRVRKNYRTSIVFAGLVLLVALAAAVTGVRYRRSQQAPKLNNRDTVVLADFSNSTGEHIFDNVLKQALEVSLRPSPLLNILPDSRVESTLKQMTRPPGSPVTNDVAREICERANGKAFIAGSIALLGKQYVLNLRAAACDSGDVLAEEQITADRKEGVVAALGRGVANLREKLGESLPSVQKFNKPLDEATTSTLEALTQYSIARRMQREQ